MSSASISRPVQHIRLAVRDGECTKPLNIFPWTTVVELKEQLATLFDVPPADQELFHGKVALSDFRTLNECHLFETEKKVLTIQLKPSEDCFLRLCPGHISRKTIENVVTYINNALTLGFSPVLSNDGTGGTYILKDSAQQPQAIFKPLDEEPYAPMNPRGYQSNLDSLSLRPGVLSGEAGYREVAAYLLDHSHFSGVPETVLAESMHPSYSGQLSVKIGSLQLFVPSMGCAEDFSYSKYTREQVQRVAILDIRILNMDRNESNLLVAEDFSLIPIDHGLSIPDCFEIYQEDLCWMNWPQAKEPITPKCLEYIEQLNPVKDIQLIEDAIPFRDTCLKNIRVSTLLLKKAAQQGLTLWEIGTMLYRKHQKPSPVEIILYRAEQLYYSTLAFEEAPARCNSQIERMLKQPRRSNSFTEAGLLKELEVVRQHSPDRRDTIVLSVPESKPNHRICKSRSMSVPAIRRRVPHLARQPSAGGNCAFDDKLFKLIEAFIDHAVRAKLQERRSFLNIETPTGRPRSNSATFETIYN